MISGLKKAKKAQFVRNAKAFLSKYVLVYDIKYVSNYLLQKTKNDLRRLNIETLILKPGLWHLVLENRTLKGEKLLIACKNTVELNVVTKYFSKNNNWQTFRYLKVGEKFEQDYVIDKGLTRLKAGVAYQLLEAITAVRLQKSTIYIEKQILLKKGDVLSTQLHKILFLLELRLKKTKLKNATILILDEQHSLYREAEVSEKVFILQPHSLEPDLERILIQLGRSSFTSVLTLETRLTSICRLLHANINTSEKHF